MVAAEVMMKAGFTNVKSLRGGLFKWHKNGYPMTTTESEEDLIYFIDKRDEITEDKQALDEIYTGEINKKMDARNLSCPKPVMMSKKTLEKMKVGQVLEVLATDPGSKRDIPAWIQVTGQEIISIEDVNSEEIRFIIKKLK